MEIFCWRISECVASAEVEASSHTYRLRRLDHDSLGHLGLNVDLYIFDGDVEKT